MSESVPWRVAWQSALYGRDGFYRRASGPAAHFTTATHAGPGRALARTLWAWADRYGLDGIVDVGAGRGELLRHLYAGAPGRPLTGLDVVARPADLPAEVGWVESPGGPDLPADWRPGRSLVVAHEWLDVVPCTVAEVAHDGSLRELLVHPAPGSCSEPHANSGSEHHERIAGTATVRVGSRVVPAVLAVGHRSERPGGRPGGGRATAGRRVVRPARPATPGIGGRGRRLRAYGRRTDLGRGRSSHTERGVSSTRYRTGAAT